MEFDGVKCTEKYLDRLDLEAEAVEFGGCDIDNFMEFLENKYGDSLNSDLRFNGYVFNWMNTVEFLDYLSRRYGNKFRYYEIIKYDFSFNK